MAGGWSIFPGRRRGAPISSTAAVAVCVSEHDGALTLLLTQRAAGLRAHSRHWALPGGQLDGQTAVGAAVRELEEGMGLVLHPEGVLGLLDDYVTRWGNVITPAVFA